MTWVLREELRGPVGTFDAVDVVELPYGEDPFALIEGTPEHRTVTFGVPRGQPGMPGLYAVANDAAFAGAVLTDATATQGALNGRYTVYRRWDGAAYPPAVSGAVNVFAGQMNPATVAVGFDPARDVWAGAPLTTLDAVAAAAADPSKPLYTAIKATSSPAAIFIGASDLDETDSRIAAISHLAEATNSSLGVTTRLMPTGATTVAGAVVRMPDGWTRARARILWTHNTASAAGNVFLLARCSRLYAGGALGSDGGPSVSATSPVPAQITIRELVLTDVYAGAGGDLVRVNIARLGSDSSDTFTGPIHLVGVVLERIA